MQTPGAPGAINLPRPGPLFFFRPQGQPCIPVQHCPLYCSETLVCSDVLPLACCQTAAGVTNPQAMTATAVVVTASMVRRVNKGLTGTAVVVSGSVVKRANKALTATSVVVSATLVASKAALRTLTATSVVVTATISRQVAKTLTGTAVALTGAIARQTGKQLAATAVALTGTIVRQVGKLFTGSSTVTATQTPTFVAGGGVTNPKAMTATSVVVTASMTATFIPAPTFGVSVQDFSPILAAV